MKGRKNQRFAELAKFLKKKRTEREMSQAELAKLIGFGSSQFVSNWERGVSSPAFNSLPQLCRILKMRESEIIKIFLRVTLQDMKEAFSKANNRSKGLSP